MKLTTRATIARIVLLGVLPGVLLAHARAGVDPQQVEVAADQSTTVIGTFDSVAELLADLCTKANVDLRAYGSPDRAVTANYVKRPLAEVIERLLSQEDYLLGVRESDSKDGPVRVAWIRVTGTRKSNASALPGGITAPSHFGTSDFQREKAADTLRAQKAVAEHMLADEAHVAEFLKVEPDALARSLQQYPHIEALLRKLRAEQQHPAVIEKLDAVIHELAAPAGRSAD